MAPTTTRLRCEHLTNPLGLDTPRPRLSWEIHSERRGASQSAYQLEVRADGEKLWDSGRIASSSTSLVPYGGPPLRSRQRCEWRVRVWDDQGVNSAWSNPAYWEMGLLSASDWIASWVTVPAPPDDDRPAPYLRTEFALPTSVRRARAYVSALGLYELHCNGKKVGDEVLRPGWTDYHRRQPYQVLDLTDHVKAGSNAIGMMIADGWYAGYIGYQGDRALWGRWPEGLLQLEVETDDGALHRFGTSTQWRGSFGSILAADLQQGERADLRLEPVGWTEPAFDDSAWNHVVFGHGALAPLTAPRCEPARVTALLKPVAITSPAPNIWVVDMGQNLVGWCRLHLNGLAGTRVRLRHGEMLEPDGWLYTENLRGAAALDEVVLSGTGTDIWEPRFTFHGFRYVEVTGLDEPPDLETVTGVVVGTDTPRSGSFSCSDELVEKLQHNIVWGQRGNFLEVPTDCPQRDERLGWTGDAQVFAPTASYNMDVAAFFTKWLADLRDAQQDSGAYRDVAPRFHGLPGTAAPAWGDAGVIVPWVMWRRYGDLALVQEHYDSMCRWIDYLHRHNPDLLWRRVRGNDYGDWLAIGADTPHESAATAWWAHSTRLLSQMAQALGEQADAARYGELADGIRVAFQRRYVGSENVLLGATQTLDALALRFDLLTPEQRDATARHLADDVRMRGHLSTGFMGVAHLLPALTEIGELDLAYTLLRNETFPSWGYSIRHGATTVWERWDGWTHDRGFQDVNMNSFNHYAYGAVGEWIYEVVGGIGIGAPGHARTIVRPRPGGGLSWADASYRTVHGEVSCNWELTGDQLRIRVTVPTNTAAQIWLPTTQRGEVQEGGLDLAAAPGIQDVTMQEGCVVLEVGSGRYDFLLPYFATQPLLGPESENVLT